MINDVATSLKETKGLIIVEGHASGSLLENLESNYEVDVASLKIIHYKNENIVRQK